jgi:hypothetical protein
MLPQISHLFALPLAVLLEVREDGAEVHAAGLPDEVVEEAQDAVPAASRRSVWGGAAGARSRCSNQAVTRSLNSLGMNARTNPSHTAGTPTATQPP